jgi:hypothetical protein
MRDKMPRRAPSAAAIWRHYQRVDISSLSDPVSWQHVSDKAYEQAQLLTWDHTLRPLDTMLRATPPQTSST